MRALRLPARPPLITATATRLSPRLAAPRATPAPTPRRAALAPPASQPRVGRTVFRRAGGGEGEKVPFGYTRKDVIVIGAAVFGGGVAAYYGLQASGVDAGRAGNYVQLAVFCFLTFGWVGSYLWRVATKNMSYVKQLEAYEDAVMEARLAEMPPAERAALLAEAEEAREASAGGKE